MTSNTLRIASALLVSGAFILCSPAIHAAKGKSKSDKLAAKAEQYELFGDHDRARSYRESTGREACWPEIVVDFDDDGYSVEVESSKDLSNVVLLFADGTTERQEDLDGRSQIFSASGPKVGQLLTGIWVKSGCNHSGDGPGYGEFFENTTNTTGLPVVSIAGAPVTVELQPGDISEAVFTISLSEMVPLDGEPVTVLLTTRDGTATAGLDYLAEEFVLTFYPGQISLEISILVTGDHVMEVNEESYYVELSNPTNALLGNSSATGWILDDDGDF